MKLENQVCSLDLAKKLKSLNVKQESLFVWCDEYDLPCWKGAFKRTNEIAAFTASELGEMLPRDILLSETEPSEMEISQLYGKHWQVYYPHTVTHNAPTEADARAKALIWLIENNHIEV